MSLKIDSFFSKLINGANNISSQFSNLLGRTDDKNGSLWTPPFNNNLTTDQLFRKLALNYAPSEQDGKGKLISPPSIRPPKVDQTGSPQKGFEPYELTIVIPKGQETLSYKQLENIAIKSIFDQNGIEYSRASLEEVANKEKIDFSPGYNYAKKDYEFNDKDGLWLKSKPEIITLNGKQQKVVRLTITPELQQGIAANKTLSETIKASGKKTFAELNMNERMQMAMQMAYDKHYLPHDVQEALKDIDPKQLLAGTAVAGSVVYVASKGGAAKAIPLIGAGVTLAQVSYYYGQADGFLKACKDAKSPEELDAAAQHFATLIKQGGVDLTITVATAGVSKIGKVSKMGGDAVGLLEDGLKATWNKLNKLNDEIVAGMKQTFGEDLTFETNSIAIKTNATPNVLEDLNIYSKSDELDMLKGRSTAGKDAITETAEQGLSEKAQSGMKRLKHDIPKEVLAKAKEQLVTLNVARTELMAKMDDLIGNSNLMPDTKNILQRLKNSLQDHLKQDDLVGALRDEYNKPVVRSGDGYIYDHMDEVQKGLNSLDNAKEFLLDELKHKVKGSPEFVRISENIDAVKEMKRRVQTFLETK